MGKSLRLFFLLIIAIVLWKVAESVDDEHWNNATVEELDFEIIEDKIDKNRRFL